MENYTSSKLTQGFLGTSKAELDFNVMILKTAIGGLSVLDHTYLFIKNDEEAAQFLKAYGFDIFNSSDEARLWNYYGRALAYIQTQLLLPGEQIPEIFKEEKYIKNFVNLLLWASDLSPLYKERQLWSCAILRVIHVLIHLTNDLFTAFSDEIQEQVLKPYRQVIVTDEAGQVSLCAPQSSLSGQDSIPLFRFDVKPFKTSNSSITKLLAKPEEVAFGVLDKMGVRFLTHSLYDCFRVLQWLFRHNVLSYPHLIPDESANTLFPLNLFVDLLKSGELINHMGLKKENLSHQEVHDFINKTLLDQLHQDQTSPTSGYREKVNIFSSKEYRFIKFIVRQLVRTQGDTVQRPFMFFYPHEIQIIDWQTYQKNSVGPSSHTEYKARQKKKARERVLHWL